MTPIRCTGCYGATLKRFVALSVAIGCLVSAYGGDQITWFGGGEGFSCGVYGMQCVLLLFGKTVTPADLLQPKYVDAPRGSSMLALQHLAHDYGLQAEIVTNLSSLALRNATYPMLLHVKTQPSARTYDHFVVFLGEKGGDALICDPPFKARWMPLPLLLSVWDGSALVVSDRRIDASALFRPQLVTHSILAVTTLLALFIAKTISSRVKLQISSVRQRIVYDVRSAVLILLASLLLGTIADAINGNGFLLRKGGVGEILRDRQFQYVHTIEMSKIKTLTMNGSVLIVDARHSSDYSRGHIPGAINIEPFRDISELVRTLEKEPRGVPVVVYCQSASCPYAGYVINKLLDIGFTDVHYFKGGWMEWSKT